jgi:predicted aspartyl protease
MIEGLVEDDGWPVVHLPVAGRRWRATIDTGFKGDLELPYTLGPSVRARFFGHGRADLAGAQSVEEEYYLVDFQFDDGTVRAVASFVTGDEILIGTLMLRDYRLEIDFPARRVMLEKLRIGADALGSSAPWNAT